MAGKRQPLAALQANGRKHLTKAEIAERSAAEVHLKKPKRISVPAWLPEDLKGDFRKISKELLDADLGASQLDRDTIGRLVVAQAQYAAATRMVRDSLDQENTETCSSWSTLQEKYFKQARACANDLGLTITSRCRLIVPQGGGQAEQENPFLELISGGAERRA